MDQEKLEKLYEKVKANDEDAIAEFNAYYVERYPENDWIAETGDTKTRFHMFKHLQRTLSQDAVKPGR